MDGIGANTCEGFETEHFLGETCNEASKKLQLFFRR